MIDKLDRKIILELQKDGRSSSVDISEKIGISVASTARRINRLIKDNIIKITAMPDPEKVGLNSMAILALDVNIKQLDAICAELVKNQNVHLTALTFGRFDIIISVYSSSTSELMNIIKDEIAQIKGVDHVETFYIAELKKQTFAWILNGEKTESES